MKKLFFFLCILLGSRVFAQATYNAQYHYSIEPLVEWSEDKSVSTPEQMVFTSPSSDNMLLTIRVSSKDNAGLVERYRQCVNEWEATATLDYEEFTYNDNPAIFGQLNYIRPWGQVTAYSLFVPYNNNDYHLLFVGDTAAIASSLEVVFSTLDSFALEQEARFKAGPISQFDYPRGGATTRVEQQFNGKSIKIDIDVQQFEAAQRVVEREFMVMSRYKVRNQMAYLAWIRYYRAVYRDNYERITPIYKAIQDLLPADRHQGAGLLLQYAQTYNYVRGTTPSDLEAPVIALMKQTGDCDSRSLAYIILLNHYGVNGALFLSQHLEHAVAGVELELHGVSIEVLGRRFVVTELTTKDPLGTVPDRVKANTDWFPLFFNAPVLF